MEEKKSKMRFVLEVFDDDVKIGSKAEPIDDSEKKPLSERLKQGKDMIIKEIETSEKILEE